MTVDDYLKCIKCNKELSPQDSGGWEKIETYQTDGGKGPEIWLCPDCILASQAVENHIERLKKDIDRLQNQILDIINAVHVLNNIKVSAVGGKS